MNEKPKRAKGRNHKSNSSHSSQVVLDLKNVTLVEIWKAKNAGFFKASMEPSSDNVFLKDKTEKLFGQKVLSLATEQALNKAVEEADYQDGVRSLLSFDCMQSLSQVETTHHIIRLLGVPVTAPMKDLLSISSLGQELSEKISGLSRQNCFCLSVMPYYMGCALSPQALSDIMSSCLSIVDESHNEKSDSLLNQLRGQLLPYSIASHLDINDISDSSDRVVGTGLVLMVVVTPLSTSALPPAWNASDAQRHHMKEWAQEQQWKALFGMPHLFPQATLEACLQHCQYEWGASARLQSIFDSVLCVDEIYLESNGEDKLFLDAFIQGKTFGKASLETVCSLWCLDLVLHDFEQRGIIVHDKAEQSVTSKTTDAKEVV